MLDWIGSAIGLREALIAVVVLAIVVLIFAKPLLGVSRVVDALNTWVGRIAAWFIFLSVLVSAGNAIVRYAFNSSSNAWLEIQWIFFSVTFLLCAAWTLLSNEHIRIDIVNSLFPKPVRNGIDLFGHLFLLLPLCVVMSKLGWPFLLSSFRQQEVSTNAGGLIVWPSKLLIPLAFGLLLLQAISEIIKRSAIMRGYLSDTVSGGGHHASAEAEAARLQEALAEEAEARAKGQGHSL